MALHSTRATLTGLALALCMTACTSSNPVTPTANAPANTSHQATWQASPYFGTGTTATSIRYDVWRDDARDRDINVKLYEPDTDSPAPIVIFSHGLGGSVEAAPYIGKQLASHGFLTIHIQHPGSDREVWRGRTGRRAVLSALGQAARNPENIINRYEDIPFVLDQIEARVASGELNGDPMRMGIAGHSFGAHTVLAATGRRYRGLNGSGSFKDERLLAGLPLSPPSPGERVQPDDYDFVYGDIDRPLLHITGTKDANPLDSSDAPINRTIPFAEIDGAPQYLIIFDGADHAVFGGADRRRAKDWYPEVQARTSEAATAFFSAYLNGDADARAWLDGAGFINAYTAGAEAKRH